MKRRDFQQAVAAILLLGTPLRGFGQPVARTVRVGILGAQGGTPWMASFEQRMRELGYVEGGNLRYRYPSGDYRLDRFSEMAAELFREKLDIALVGGSELALKAARQAAGATPIVMVAIDYDPVATNHITSLSRPGGNITGVTFQHIELASKRLELLRQTLPYADRVGALFDAATRNQMQAAQEAAKTLGITLVPLELTGNPYNYDAAIGAGLRARAKAILLLSSGVFFRDRITLLKTATRHRLPVFSNPNYSDAGALLAYGPSFPEMYRRAAEYVDRILKGADPATMPVEQPTKFETVLNKKTAKALGINIPNSILVRADKVIE